MRDMFVFMEFASDERTGKGTQYVQYGIAFQLKVSSRSLWMEGSSTCIVLPPLEKISNISYIS